LEHDFSFISIAFWCLSLLKLKDARKVKQSASPQKNRKTKKQSKQSRRTYATHANVENRKERQLTSQPVFQQFSKSHATNVATDELQTPRKTRAKVVQHSENQKLFGASFA